MNKNSFLKLLETISGDDWQAVTNGKALLMVDDLHIEVGELNAANSIIKAANGQDSATLKSDTLKQAADLLHHYYLTHPLTLTGFNHQAAELFKQHGALAFTAKAGYLPQCTLFVEGGELMAETPESPRHRYGVFYEVGNHSEQTDKEKMESEVQKWLDSGAAHERYLEMNVCRYNC